MAPRSIFNLRVVRCPACHARLPVQGNEAIVVCEYCDARVELSHAPTPPTTPPTVPRRHVAQPHYSGFAWVLLSGVVLTAAGVAFAASTMRSTLLTAFESAPSSAPASPPSPVAEPAAARSLPAQPLVSEPVRARVPAPAETPAPAQEHPKPKTPSTSPKPSGPVITVPEATKLLEPKVLACMRESKTHSLLAYMGNESVGSVSLLHDSRTRVDGLRAKPWSTALGRCIDKAGATVRTRAFSSNYVRFELRNAAVPDPLAKLPARADGKAVESVIAARDAKVHACAEQHGEQGAREVFYFSIDGPTGKVISVRGSYGSRAFRSCAEAVYRTLAFAPVQQYELKHTYSIQL